MGSCSHCFWLINRAEKVQSAQTYLQPHYGNGVFSWTTLRGKHYQHPIAVMGVVDTIEPNQLRRFNIADNRYKELIS